MTKEEGAEGAVAKEEGTGFLMGVAIFGPTLPSFLSNAVFGSFLFFPVLVCFVHIPGLFTWSILSRKSRSASTYRIGGIQKFLVCDYLLRVQD